MNPKTSLEQQECPCIVMFLTECSQSEPVRVTDLYSVHYNKSSNFFNNFFGLKKIANLHYRSRRWLPACRIAEARMRCRASQVRYVSRLLGHGEAADSF
jgi:hypothetical protein